MTFNPSVVEQTRIARNGILGDFIIRYDVNRELSVGDVQVPYIRFVFSILLTIPEIVLHAPHVLENDFQVKATCPSCKIYPKQNQSVGSHKVDLKAKSTYFIEFLFCICFSVSRYSGYIYMHTTAVPQMHVVVLIPLYIGYILTAFGRNSQCP